MKKGIDWEGRIGRRLRLRDLHVLIAVVQAGSMAKAALALGSQARASHIKVLPLALPNKAWPVVMVTLKERTLSPAANQFIACARTVARSVGDGHAR